jgi:hypothetical protein
VVYSSFTQFPKVERYVETRHLDNLRARIVVDMELERHTTRHIFQVTVDHPPETWSRVWNERFNVYEDRPSRDISEVFRVCRRVVNSDPSRLGVVMEKLEKHKRLIVFYNFDYELDALRLLGETTGVTTAEWNGHRHNPLPESDEWLYLVQYTAGSEGWNCTTTDAILFYSLNYSYKVFEQCMGRIDRMNTPYFHLYYYVLRSNTMIDRSIWKAIVTKRNFSEKKMSKQQGWELAA